MSSSGYRFADRREAGRELADAVAGLHLGDPIVMALPRGGVPVAAEVAKVLGAPLDLLLVRKLGAPGHAEYGIGAIVDGADPQLVLNDEAMAVVAPPPGYLDREKARQLSELERRRKIYLGDREPIAVKGRTIVLVDDGIATGSTITVAMRALRKARVARIVVAVPVAPRGVVETLRREADDVICLATPEPFLAVGQHYADFTQTSDADVVELLRTSATAAAK